MKKKSLPISILFLVGGYSNEEFDERRINWLKKSLNDLKNQTCMPVEILISLNSNVAGKKYVKKEIDKALPNAKIVTTIFDRSGILNFELLIQMSGAKYICFWSDHDIHHPKFLEESYREIISNNASHACPLITVLSEYETDLTNVSDTILKEINTTNMKKIDAFNLCINSNIMGSIYGIWEKDIFSKVNIVGTEKFDWLLVVSSTLEKGYVFFNSSENLFSLRNLVKKPKKGFGNHSKLLPKYILSEKDYLNSNFFRFNIAILFILRESNLSREEKVDCINFLNKTLNSKTNFFGVSKFGRKIFIKELIKFLTFKSNIHELFFLFSYFLYMNFLKIKIIKN